MTKYFNKTILMISVGLFSNIFADDPGLKNYKKQNFEDAKAYYEQIIAERESDAAANLGLGSTQYQLGDIPDAAKSFENALKSEDDEIQKRALYNFGNVLYNQQRIEESVAFYRKVLETDPNDEDAKFNYELAKYFAQQEDQEEQEDPNNQQEQNNDKQDQSNKDNSDDDGNEDAQDKEPDKQDEAESDTNEDEQREAPKSQQQINAEAILDALKDEEKIHQKVKIAQQTARKFEKDW